MARRRRKDPPRLGIDFGTTHTVVALVDRGNYPVVAIDGEDAFPSLVAASRLTGELRFGSAAVPLRHDPDWEVLRSLKRFLSDGGPATGVLLGGHRFLLADLLTGFLTALADALVEDSNAGLSPGDPLEAAVSVPANSSSAQRFLTLDAFRRAGFSVTSLLNEPSAAGFEYAHRYRETITAKREYVVVYDLGGGTFDASLLRMTGRANDVVTSEGVRRLGGDDFDETIADLVASKAQLGALSGAQRQLLVEECGRQKEAISPQTRRFLVDLSAFEKDPLAIPIDDVYDACEPLVSATIDALTPVLRDARREGESEVDWNEVAGIYIVGGAGAFPLVLRRLRERFGEKRVRRSSQPFAATAIGLAITLDQEAGYTLEERLTRTFGVFREASGGGDVTFDPIFLKDTPLPRPGSPPLVAVRTYRAAHNIGHFRFLECGRLEAGRPDGDLSPWDDVRVPFDPALRALASLQGVGVERREGGPVVEERYAITAEGAVEVRVTLPEDGFDETYRLRGARA